MWRTRFRLDSRLEPVWPYDPDTDFVDFTVIATDGRAGTVDAQTYDRPPDQLVVRGRLRESWRRSLLPARVITDVDRFERRVHVALTRAQIRDLPEFSAEGGREPIPEETDDERPE
jgi:hypothetical protein